MLHKAKPDEALFIRSMNKSLRVTAIATSDEEANRFMETHEQDAVIAVFGPFVLLANVNDRGIE